MPECRFGKTPQALGLAWLSLASGCTDVLSFLKFGDVFTSAMTGNTALLAIAIGRGHLLAASHSLTALLGFTLGAVGSASLREHRGATEAPRTLAHLLLLEIVCLGACAVLWTARSAFPDGGGLYVVILLSAAAMGIQGVAARVVGSSGITTIVFTSVLVSIVTSLTDALARRANPIAPTTGLRTHLGTFAAYFSGGLLAGGLVSANVEFLVWIPMIAVALALGCFFVRRDGRSNTPST